MNTQPRAWAPHLWLGFFPNSATILPTFPLGSSLALPPSPSHSDAGNVLPQKATSPAPPLRGSFYLPSPSKPTTPPECPSSPNPCSHSPQVPASSLPTDLKPSRRGIFSVPDLWFQFCMRFQIAFQAKNISKIHSSSYSKCLYKLTWEKGLEIPLNWFLVTCSLIPYSALLLLTLRLNALDLGGWGPCPVAVGWVRSMGDTGGWQELGRRVSLGVGTSCNFPFYHRSSFTPPSSPGWASLAPSPPIPLQRSLWQSFPDHTLVSVPSAKWQLIEETES